MKEGVEENGKGRESGGKGRRVVLGGFSIIL